MFDKLIHKTLRRPYSLAVTHDSGSGDPVVFLHGIASTSRTWRNVLPLMPKTFRSITIDLLGFGESPKPDWNQYSLDAHADAVALTIKKMHLHQPVTLVGHSMGSLIAVSVAKRHPRIVRRLILCSMPIYLREESSSTFSKSDQYINNTYFRTYEAIRKRPSFTLKSAERVTKLMNDTTSFSLSSETWIPFTRSLQNTIENQTTRADILDLSQPIDIMYGTLDVLVVGSYLRTLADVRPNITVYKIVAGHEITTKYAQKLVKLLENHDKMSMP